MTIHGPGSAIWTSEIQAEFGGGNPMYLSNYYAGGPFVPAGTTAYYGPIPASGGISYRNFYGATRALDTESFVPADSGFGDGRLGYQSGAWLPGAAYGTMVNGIFAITGSRFDYFFVTNGVLGDGRWRLQFQVNGQFPNSGWNTLTVPGLFAFSRTASNAYYFGDTTQTTWGWVDVGGWLFTAGVNYQLIFT